MLRKTKKEGKKHIEGSSTELDGVQGGHIATENLHNERRHCIAHMAVQMVRDEMVCNILLVMLPIDDLTRISGRPKQCLAICIIVGVHDSLWPEPLSLVLEDPSPRSPARNSSSYV